MERVYGLLAYCLILAGCVGHTRGFSDDAKFQRYVVGLGLPSLPVVAASSKLTSEGFSCGPTAAEPVICEKTVSNPYGWQRQRVSLTNNGQGGTAAAADLALVMM
jgi:hypothetical protein